MISTWISKWAVWILALMVLLAACGHLTREEQLEAQFYATAYAKDGVIPPPKYQTLAATALNLYVPTATATPDPRWTPTMSFYDFSGTQVAQQQAINLTQGAQQLEIERERLAAEERAKREAEEARHAQETAVAYSHQQTAEARVWFAQQTAYVESTMAMRTAEAASTATVYMQQLQAHDTAVAGTATMAIAPTHAIWTQNAVYAAETVTAGEAKKVELATRRQEMKNIFDAYLPWVLIVSAVYVLGHGFAQYVKTRVHTRDEHGATPLLEMKTDNGDRIIVKPDAMEGSVIKVQPDGAVVRYAPMDINEQSDITRRAQAVEAIRALPSPYAPMGGKILTAEFGRGSRSRVTINQNADAMRAALDEADRGFLSEAKDE